MSHTPVSAALIFSIVALATSYDGLLVVILSCPSTAMFSLILLYMFRSLEPLNNY